jgi:uncharacterized protein YecT (DUF1311 family)
MRLDAGRRRRCARRALFLVLPLLTVLAIPGRGSATIRTPPAPPVIHEHFTLLPCPRSKAAASTTIGIEGCQEHAIVRSDAKIDTLAKLILAQLHDLAARRRFVAGERSWLAYRRAFCLSQSDLYEGGTASPIAYGACVVGVNAQHVAALAAFHGDLSH